MTDDNTNCGDDDQNAADVAKDEGKKDDASATTTKSKTTKHQPLSPTNNPTTNHAEQSSFPCLITTRNCHRTAAIRDTTTEARPEPPRESLRDPFPEAPPPRAAANPVNQARPLRLDNNSEIVFVDQQTAITTMLGSVGF